MKKNKTELACAKAIADLTEKGYRVFIPATNNDLPFDLIAYQDDDMYFRIKVQYYDPRCDQCRDGFDYLGLYIPEKDVVIYPYATFQGEIQTKLTGENDADIYWYEDFLDLTDSVKKTRPSDIQPQYDRLKNYRDRCFDPRKNPKLLRSQVDKLGWTGTGRLYGVADNTIRHWIKTASIDTTTNDTIQKEK